MVKKAAKKKTARKKSAKKSAKKGPVNVPEIREQVRHLIAEQVEPMVTANTEEASKGHLSQLKYLFEVLGVYPAPAGEAEPEDSNDLAKVLLNRLDFPHREPVEEEQDEIAVPAGTGNDSVE
jgi:hypothetical protein